MAGPGQRPSQPGGVGQGFARADAQPDGTVGQVCATCPDNWVEAGAIDEGTGQPIPGLGYRIYDLVSGERVAQGVLDEQGESPRHQIPQPVTQLYVLYGTDAAMDEAEAGIEAAQRDHAVRANAKSQWKGFPAGMDRAAFDAEHERRLNAGEMVEADRGYFEGAWSGARGLGDIAAHVATGEGLRAGALSQYHRRRDDAWNQYRLVTGAQRASVGESIGGGADSSATFGFSDEIAAGLGSLFDGRTYQEHVAARRHVADQRRLSNPGAYLGGEVLGAIPTVFIPVGGAAGAAARTGQGARGAMIAGGGAGAVTGGLTGAGNDTGTPLERLDGAALGAATGGLGGALLSGAGVLVARGVAKTRIWGRAPRPGSLDNKAAREWYLEQERLIPERLDPNAPLEAQARQAHQLRNAARTQARDLMADRELAAQLARDNPNLTWDQIVARTRAKGFGGDDVFNEIIASSQRSRGSVNKKLGLE
ncbi:hypothetical protein [Jannaschia marina]|uniref:hypothetical protein n=1 Tax=Jannaschia marina TaxID=2741674 RepID=UPI0015C9CA77|nr:hypothetical protein [Jannaschia marina]